MEPGPDTNPIALFQEWLAEARATGMRNTNAMTLATVSPGGEPSARIVLLKRADERGFSFYTNRDSRKGRELRKRPVAALCFHGDALGRQVRVEGPVVPVDDAEADAYYAGRPRESQLGAWASSQSEPLDSRETFEARLGAARERFAGSDVPRPPYWSGFRVVPHAIEFWIERPHRLHDRFIYQRDGDEWTFGRLYP
jgi:pyridoxamine 5'-phosphate oxidase